MISHTPATSTCVGYRAARVAALLLTAALTLAAAGCSSGASAPEPTGAASPVSAAGLVGPAEFAAEIATDHRYLLNVHTPDEGSLTGTDAAIPFDQIDARAEELPPDLTMPIAVYCMSGNMSQTAVDRLDALGYTDVVELRGGMIAWQEDGRALTGVPPL